MERLTRRDENGNAVIIMDGIVEFPNYAVVIMTAYNRLAAYEDTGLTPEQAKTATRIAERIATADYPHNFQRERRDIVDYMNWITDVMRDAKEWWNGRIKDKGGT